MGRIRLDANSTSPKEIVKHAKSRPVGESCRLPSNSQFVRSENGRKR